MTIQFNNNGFALASGEVTVYITDNQGIYSHSEQEFVAEGTGLSAGAYLDAPPAPKANFAIVRSQDGLRWEYVADYRGQTYYDTATGGAITINELGKIPKNLTALKPLDKPCKWDGNKWVLDESKQAKLRASQQAEVWGQIKQKRYQNCRSGVYVKSVDKWFHSDDASRQQYTFMRTLPDFPATRWKTMDNSFVEMTKALLNELSLAMFAHEQADFANAERHRLGMLAAENPLDYDYSTGWQEVYGG